MAAARVEPPATPWRYAPTTYFDLAWIEGRVLDAANTCLAIVVANHRPLIGPLLAESYELPRLRAAARLSLVLAETVVWSRATFPWRLAPAIVAHLRREVAELSADPADPEEIADCLILLASLADVAGIDLSAAVEAKLATLRGRRWGEPDAAGVIEHVRESE